MTVNIAIANLKEIPRLRSPSRWSGSTPLRSAQDDGEGGRKHRYCSLGDPLPPLGMTQVGELSAAVL